MNIPIDELITILSSFNPWWRNEAIADLPDWRRAAFNELFTWTYEPPAPRALLLSGARQVGKTTLLLQVIDDLLKNGINASNILYATFDHPLIKLAGVDATLAAWRMRVSKGPGPEYLFLDEAQFIRDSGTWIKHQVDFKKDRRIVFTGSAMPLIYKEMESGVGRWHTIKLATLSFYEYLRLKKESEKNNPYTFIFTAPEKNLFFSEKDKLLSKENIISFETAPLKFDKFIEEYNHRLKPTESLLAKHILPALNCLEDLFSWPSQEFHKTTEIAAPYVSQFHEYLLRGGFPQTTQIKSIEQAQRLLREDIVDKVLKRDMTALFGVRRVLELEQVFLYLCMHDGGLLNIQKLCSNLGVQRPTAQKFIELLENSHLIYRLQPFGYGKEVLRGKYKIYLADAAIAPAVLLKGKHMLDNANALGTACETAVFKHLFTRQYQKDIRFTYWQNDEQQETDLIAEANNQIIPFEVKYRSQHTNAADLKGLLKFCQERSVEHAYIITKSLDDFGLIQSPKISTKIMRIPAPLFCYWIDKAEIVTA